MGHWTQSPNGRKKLAASMRRSWKKRNGHVNGTTEPEVKEKRSTKTNVTRERLVELAKAGARQRLQELEKEVGTLRIFLGEVKR